MRQHLFSKWLLGAAVCVGAVGCGGAEAPPASASATATASSEAGMAYPELYRSMSLPEIEDGTLTSTGRQSTSLRDGLALTLTTTKTVDQAREFYHSAMTTLGWTEQQGGRGGLVPNLPVANVTFNKDGVTFTATVTATGATESRIDIRVLER